MPHNRAALAEVLVVKHSLHSVIASSPWGDWIPGVGASFAESLVSLVHFAKGC